MMVTNIYDVLFLCLSIAFACYVKNGYQYRYSLPYPYDYFTIQDIPEEYRDIIDSITTPSANAVELYANEHNIDIHYMNHTNVNKLFVDEVVGTESVEFIETKTESKSKSESESEAKLTMIDKYGYIHTAKKYSSISSDSYVLMNSSLYIGPGRSLGFRHVDVDTLIVCNSLMGLIQVNITGLDADADTDGRSVNVNVNNRISILSNSYMSQPLHYCNDIDIDVDTDTDATTIYYSSSTANSAVVYDAKERYYDTLRGFLLVWTGGDVSGRVFSYNVNTHTTTLLVDNLYYANGVVVAKDGSFLLIVDTVGLRVLKFHLRGERAGSLDVYIDHLPGFPDGITKSADGLSYYVSLVSPLTPFFTYGKSRAARYAIAWATAGPFAWVFSGLIKKFGCILHVVDNAGTGTGAGLGVVDEIHFDKRGSILSTISAVTPHPNGKELFVGNLGGDFVSIYTPVPLPRHG